MSEKLLDDELKAEIRGIRLALQAMSIGHGGDIYALTNLRLVEDYIDAQERELQRSRSLVGASLTHISWEYEDQLPTDLEITTGMYRASWVDVVRMYPYIEMDGCRWYLEANPTAIALATRTPDDEAGG